ncbi:hypothetical protein [Duganella radicis]|uniref:Uncharacterized protein n=1 Tax=Duganella radicis TaxID=551988 RepID=A0A6L6PRI8_9BURK|nr:hypothetical protein [Duganella radicis]MTV41247.1 hypothetical protein [Duganella radicis]
MQVMSFYEQYLTGLRSALLLLEQALENRQPAHGVGEHFLRLRLLFEDATVSFDHVMRCMQAHAQTGGPQIEGELAARLDECRDKLVALRVRCTPSHQVS